MTFKNSFIAAICTAIITLTTAGCATTATVDKPVYAVVTTPAATTTVTTTVVKTESVPDETNDEVQRLIGLITSDTSDTSATTTVETESIPDETDDEIQRLIGLIGNNASTTTTTTAKPTETTKPAATTTAKPAETTKPAATTTAKPAETTKPTETTKPAATTTAKPAETTKPVETNAISNKLADIKKICGLKSDVETDIKACAVDVFDAHNPYDVVYDYGTAYNAYVNACDWNLVFDADYYIEQFPMLATLYHNDKALLLEHFQTIGIHEGRQGSANFNVGAYKANCDSNVRNTFGNNYEGYYFYYMLNYKTEKSIKTTGSKYEVQYKQIMTKCQIDELAGVNNYRDEVNVADIAFDSELAAFANYRAWVNAHDDWRGHKWTYEPENYNIIKDFANSRNARSFAENTAYYLDSCRPYGKTSYAGYRTSTSHYEAMINANYDLIGLSNVYYSWSDTFTNHFQTFLNL